MHILLRTVLGIVLQRSIDMIEHSTLCSTVLKLHLNNINVSRPALFYCVAEFIIGSLLIKSAMAMCKYV